MKSRLIVTPLDGLTSPSAEAQRRKEVNMKKSALTKVSKKGEVLCRIKLKVNEETIGEIGNEIADIQYTKLGAKYVPCKYEWVSEEIYVETMRLQWAEAKAEERAKRCRIPNGNGGTIRCPERNKCNSCEKVGTFEFDNYHVTSLDALMTEADAEPTSVHCDLGSDLEVLEFVEWLVDELSKVNPKYGEIFRVMFDGVIRPSHIAKITGIPNSTVAKYVPIIQALAQELYLKN